MLNSNNRFIATLVACLFLTLTNGIFAQENTVLPEVTSDPNATITEDRLSFESNMSLTGLAVGYLYRLSFATDGMWPDDHLFFTQKEVDLYYIEDNYLFFIPKKNNIHFSNPGYDCEGEIINRSSFNIENMNPNKSVVGIAVQDGDSPLFLIENVLLGDFCLSISNVSAPGGASAYGRFYNGQSNIQVETGVIMTTGNITTALGPNNTSGNTTTAGTAGVDTDLAQFTGSSNLNDVAILEFDFVPDEDSISFDYVFASEEYCDYVGASFNDAFGFFISGPGINGPYTNNAENIALIPGTNVPVTINNVNYTTNSAYYVSNVPLNSQSGGNCAAGEPDTKGLHEAEIQFDGFTTVLKAKSAVVACETYHIKLVIADVNDGAFDSGVFLGQNSFVSGDPGVIVTTEVGYTESTDVAATEGCSGAFIAFAKNFTLETVIFDIIIDNTSTATEGLDYAAFAGEFVFESGKNRDTIFLDIFNDLLDEGIETIDIRIEGLCECTNPFITVNIKDPDPLEFSPIDDQGFCTAQFVTVSANPSGGTEPYHYNWSNGSNSQNNTIQFSESGFHYVTITDDCSQERLDTFFLELYPNYEIYETVTICEGESYFVGGAPQSTAGQYLDMFPTVQNCDSSIFTDLIVLQNANYDTLIYACANTTVNIGGQSINFPGLTDVSIDNAANNGCDSIIAVTVEWLSPFSTIADPDTLSCSVDSVQLLTIIQNTGQGFEYFWTGPEEFESNEEHPWASLPGTYTLVVTQTVNGVYCESFFPFSNDVFIDTLAPEIEEIPDLTISCGLTDVSIDPLIINLLDLDTVFYDWVGPNDFMSTNESITVSDSGTYILTVVNPGSDCFTQNEFHISIDNVQPAISGTGGAIGCNTDSIQVFSSVNLINGEFIWTGPNGYQSDLQNPFVFESGTYYITYELTDLCIAYDTIDVTVDNTIPELTAVGDTIVCSQGDGIVSFVSGTMGIEYEWTGPNNFISDEQNPIVTEEGLYTIIVTGTNGCTNEQSVQLVLTDIIPDVEGLDDKIDCGEDFVNLEALVSDNDLIYLWTGPNNFMSTDPSPQTNTAGMYTLVVTNTEGCENTATLELEADTLIPQVDILTPIITCENPVPMIDVFNIDEALDFSWTGPNSFNSLSEDISISDPGVYNLVITSANGCDNNYSVQVEIDTLYPSFTAFGDTLDCNNGVAELTSDVSGPLFDIKWYDEDNNVVGLNANETVGSDGLYTLIVTNKDNGCQNSETVEIFKNEDVPDLSVLGDTINCLGNSFAVFSGSTTPGVTFSWEGPNSFSSSEESPIVSEPGNYVVTITAPNGCIAIDNAIVVDDSDLPMITAANEQLNCHAPSLILDIDASGSGNIYDWSGPNSFTSNIEDPTIVESGTYTVVVTSENGCMDSRNVIITEDFVVPTANLGVSNVIDCANDQALISLITNAPAGSIFSWTGPGSFSSSEEDITVSVSGIYNVMITGLNGCSRDTFVEVFEDTQAIELTSNDGLIDCDEPTVELDILYSNTDIVEIQWTGPNSFNSVQLKPIVDAGGLYELNITASNGCTSTTSIMIVDNIEYPETSLSADDLNCLVDEVDINSSLTGNPFNFSWQDTDETPYPSTSNISVTEAGYYFLTITNGDNGCSYEDSILINALPELISYDFTVENPNCVLNFGEINIANVVGGTAPYQYSIDGGATFSQDPDFTDLDGGLYDLVIVDNSGCELTGTASINSLEEFDITAQEVYALILGNQEQIIVTTTIQANDIQSVTWFPEDYLSCTDCLNPIITATQDQTYIVTLIDKNGCELSTVIDIRVAENPIYIPNIFSPNDDGVNDEFSILGNFNTIEVINEFSIYDRWGNNVFEVLDVDPKQESIVWNGDFKGSAVKQGVYGFYITYKSISGEEKVLIGDITIVR